MCLDGKSFDAVEMLDDLTMRGFSVDCYEMSILGSNACGTYTTFSTKVLN